MIEIKCKSLFNGHASVGSHILDEARAKGDDLTIIHKDKKMSLRSFMLGKFFTYGKGRQYPHKDGRSGFYTLKYIKFVADEKEKENG